MSVRRTAVMAAVLLGSTVSIGLAQERARQPARPGPLGLERIAEFPHQVTGVTVSPEGRVFVNFPRWTEDSPISVAEVRDGRIAPFPDARWNEWRNARRDELQPGEHFVCVQSVVVDPQGRLWALDAGAPAQGYVVAGAPKLVRIDLAANRADRTILFDETVAPQGSYLNDVRFTPDGRHAFITDSGAKGAIVVVELESGKARRVLDGHPSTQTEKAVTVTSEGKPLRRPDGRGVEFAADGIAISPDGGTLYWQAIKGKTLYRVPTEALIAAFAENRDVGDRVERFGENGVADGLLIGKRDGRMYVTAPEEDAVKSRDLAAGAGAAPTVLLRDPRLRWPDTLAEGPDGRIYVTTSRIQDSALFKPGAPKSLTTQLWRFDPRAGDRTGSTRRP